MAIAFVLGLQDLADFRLVLGEIVERNETIEPRHVVDQHASGLAAIEFRGAFPGDAFESGGEFRLTDRPERLPHSYTLQARLPA